MKANLRYQNGYMYEDHGSWCVRYRQRISQEDGSSKVSHVCKRLGRSKDFSNIFEVERCRAAFRQTVNRDRLCANSSTTLTTFLEGAYLPWTKRDGRAGTSNGHHEGCIKTLLDRDGDLRLAAVHIVATSAICAH